MVKRSFRTAYDSLMVVSEAGDPIEPVYSAHYSDDGTLVLEITGKRDVYAEIQSHKESTDIHTILKRYELGDTSVLSRVQGFYDDISEIPTSYHEVLNNVTKAETYFGSLPADVRAKFDNSFSKFLVAVGNGDFAKVLSEPAAISEVVDDVEPVKDVVKEVVADE